MGVRQIYYGETNSFIAFASERKAPWKVGIKEPTKCVLPGRTDNYHVKWLIARIQSSSSSNTFNRK